MAPGPKKRNFHTPRNTKNAPNPKTSEKKNIDSNSEINKNADTKNTSADCVTERDKFSKRTVESNWNKYEEPVNDPHADSMRGEDFNVLLSYSGGSGSQLKLQDEKEWEDEYTKDISLHIPDLINAMKCIPFHVRIGMQSTGVFDDKAIMNFNESSRKCALAYESQSSIVSASGNKDVKESTPNPRLNIIEEPDAVDPDDFVPVKNFPVQDETENIINSLASNLSFKNFSDKEESIEKEPVEELNEEAKPESASNDLDFLLSLNISSKVSVKKETSTAPKSDSVDDWLNSILDD